MGFKKPDFHIRLSSHSGTQRAGSRLKAGKFDDIRRQPEFSQIVGGTAGGEREAHYLSRSQRIMTIMKSGRSQSFPDSILGKLSNALDL
jgi:hypothetical protein